MKAIIIAAGLGSRLGALTSDRPKCTLPVQGRSIIGHQLAAFKNVGISDVSVVTGFAHKFLSEIADVRTFHNATFRANNVLLSLMHAQQELNDDVVISYSDILFQESLLAELLVRDENFCLVADRDWTDAYVGRSEHPVAEAEKIEYEAGRMMRIGKHLSPTDADAEFIGLFKMSREGCSIWNTRFNELRAELASKPFGQAGVFEKAYLTDFFQHLIDRGQEISSLFVSGRWMEIDTPQDYARAQSFQF